MPIQQHVNARAQISGTDVLVPQVGIGNLALIQRISNPSDRIRISPRDPQADARCFGRVTGTSGAVGDLHEVEAEFDRGPANRSCSPFCAKDPGPCGEFAPPASKSRSATSNRSLTGGNARPAMILPSIPQQIKGACAGQLTGGMRRFIEGVSADHEPMHRSGNRLQMIVRGKFPGHVVVWRLAILGIVLRR